MSTTHGVIVTVDTRAFPMEIAKKLLQLGNALNMSKGPTAYYEAEKSLVAYLDVLTTYAHVMWHGVMDFRMQQRAVEKYCTSHWGNPRLQESQARGLLDFMHYFPEVKEREYEYERTLDEDERKGD